MSSPKKQQQKPSATSSTPKFSIQKTSHAIHLFAATSVVSEFKDFVAMPKLPPQLRRAFQSMNIPVPGPVRGTAYQMMSKEENVLQASSVINFWPCFPSLEYDIIITYKNSENADNDNAAVATTTTTSTTAAKPSFVVTVSTSNTVLNDPTMIIVNSQEMMENPGVMDIVLACKDDYLIMTEKGIHTNPKFLASIFWNALFILPHDNSPISSCPNCEKRFCIDLEGRVPNPETWISGKKMKKFLTKEFELELTNDFGDLLMKAGHLHNKIKKGTWIIPSFVTTLQRIAKDPSAPVQMLAFVLREKRETTNNDDDDDEKNTTETRNGDDDHDHLKVAKKTSSPKGKVVAATFGFACGNTFHDYTMATFVQDNRSCGSIVTKLSGYILQKAGVKLWYWGMQVEYMKEYLGKYGAVEFSKNEFYEKWNKYRGIPLEKPLRDAAVDICAGINLPFENVSAV